MKNWHSFSALKRVKNETEVLTVALANALETVIVTPAGDEKSLAGLAEPVKGFGIIPGIMQLLEYPYIAILADEILDMLQDTLNHPDLDQDKLDARLQIAYVATSDVPALFEDALKQSGDSFIKVFDIINQVRKSWDRAAIFDSRTLSAKQKVSFRKQFAASPDKMKDMLSKQATLYMKAGRVLLDNPGNEKAATALKGIVANMELMLRDCRLGTLWGLAAGVLEALKGSDTSNESLVKAVIALGKPLYLLSTGDLSQLDRLDDKALGNLLAVISESKVKSMRLAIIRQWYGLDRTASKQMKAATRNIQLRYAKKSALNKSLHLINEDINALTDTINMLIESGQVTHDKVESVYLGVSSLREVLVFLRMNFLADHIDQTLSPEPDDNLEDALSEAAGVLFVINKELADKLENMEREVFSNEEAITESSSLSAARLHVYLTAMKLMETVITAIDAFVENGCQGSDLVQVRDILDELACVFTLVSLPEQQQYLVTAKAYVHLVVHGVGEDMATGTPDTPFHALSHLAINSLGYLEQLSIGRDRDSRAFLEKSGRFADILKHFVDSHPTPDPGNGPDTGPEKTQEEVQEEAQEEVQAVPDSAQQSETQALALPASSFMAGDADNQGGAPGDQPEHKPGDIPDEAPVPDNRPDEAPVPDNRPDEDPVPNDVPEDRPNPATEPDEVPVPDPVPVEEPVEVPDTTAMAGHAGDSDVVPAHRPQDRPGDVPEEDPDPNEKPEDDPESDPDPVREPDEVPVPDPPVEEPEDVPGEEPVPIEEPEDIPDDEPIPIDEPGRVPEETPVPVEEPPSVPTAMAEDNSGYADNEEEEIKEIFAEEFDEVLENLQEALASLANDFKQPAVLKDCCRYFHTLKGSGRMVGAGNIGWLSFAMEKLYDFQGEKQETNADVMDLTRRVLDVMPGMKAHFMDGSAPTPDLEHVEQLCHEALGYLSPEAVAEVDIPVLQGKDTEDSVPQASAAESADIPIVTDSVPTLSEFVDISEDEVVTDMQFAIPDDTASEDIDSELVSRELADINNRISLILAGNDESPDTSDLLVPLHTLYGIARVQNLENYTSAVKAMEAFQESHPHKTITADMAVVFQGFCLLTDKLARHVANHGNNEYVELAFDVIDLEKELSDLSDSLHSVDASPASGLDASSQDPVIAGFLREARSLLATLAQDTQALHDNPESPGLLEKISQSLHLLAGAAEMAELEEVEKVAATLEAVYSQHEVIARQEISALLAEAHAWLAAIPLQLDAGDSPEAGSDLCDRLLVAMTSPARTTTELTLTEIQAPEDFSAGDYNPDFIIEIDPEPEPEPEPEQPPEQEYVSAQEQAPVAEAEEAVDQDLMAIFLDEADEILEALDELYLRWQEGDQGVIDEYLRHLHTLKGSSALVLEKHLSKAAHDYETFLIDARKSGKPYDRDFFAASDRHLQTLQEIYRLYSRDASGLIVRQPSPESDESATASGSVAEASTESRVQVQDARQSQEPEAAVSETETSFSPEPEPEPKPETEVPAEKAPAKLSQYDHEDLVDQTLMAIFLDEAAEILEEIDSLYLRWQEGDESVIDEYLRHLHTLKGSSALVREIQLSKSTHEFETFIVNARNARQGYDAEFFVNCDRHMQALQEIYKLYSKDDQGLIVRAEMEQSAAVVAEYQSTSDIAPTAFTSPSTTVPDAAGISVPEGAVVPAVRAAEFPRAQADHSKSQIIQAAAEEQVRVSSQLLKKLLNDADEINFSRNRIEKNFNDISTLLVDMDETLSKVKSYVKRFEDKARESYTSAVEENTEQGIAPEGGRISDEFDSLEMDRYTELHEMSLSLTEDYDDLQDIRMNLAGRLREVDNVLLGQQRLTNSLQDGLISSQMVPFASIIPRLRRLVRQISRELEKDVRFEVENQQGNLDKNVLQAIITPFEHIIRNALDHGIEAPGERAQAGKAEQAVLSVKVTRVGASILIEIKDDGRGINVGKVKSRAIERGILDKDADISHDAACQLIFKPGFSTADAVSSISGRGVGLDVVKSEISQIGGTVEISSSQGQGTAFMIQLPLTTSLNRSLMFEVQGNRYVVLMNTLDGVKVEKLASILQKKQLQQEQLQQEQLQKEQQNKALQEQPQQEHPQQEQQDDDAIRFEYGGKQYEYVYLGKLLGLEIPPKLESVDTAIPMLLVSGRDRNFALHIDAITESRDLVVKSFSKQFAAMPGIGGGVIMPDGNVAIVLDLVDLINHLDDGDEDAALDMLALDAGHKESDKRRRVVMVVDDSITVRKVTSSTLKRHGLDVITAKNGLEAIEQLEYQVPDVILLDIEMPKMDGFEVAAHIRKQKPPIGSIPIIMITSRIGDKHRARAQEIGVNEFMSKPFVENVLIEHIRSYDKKR